MADGKRRAKRAGLVTGALAVGVGAVVAAGVGAERAFLRREQRRPDPYKDEEYGTKHGRSIGPVASFDGTLLHVEEAGAGQTVIFSHGFSLNSTLWHHQLKDLAGDMRLVLYDHRGHGYSGLPPSEDWSLDALAHDLEAVIRDAAPDEEVVIVGHSMGGMTALRYCELYPEAIGTRVRGLVLADTSSADVAVGMLPNVAGRLEILFQGLQETAMRAIAGRADHVERFRTRASNLVYLFTRLMGFGKNPSPTQVAFIDRLLAQVPSHVWVSLIPAMVGMDVSENLPLITVPTKVIVGENDRITPISSAERIANAIPNADLVVFPDTGHVPMLERASHFNDLLRRFLAEVRAADAAR
ncbi:MAG: alpha/beta fold hydrolase [Actinomycetota bacterium]